MAATLAAAIVLAWSIESEGAADLHVGGWPPPLGVVLRADGLTAVFVLAIAIGFLGLKLEPRSYAMVASAGALVLASLAMVTVTLVSTDENPGPADGALLMPYLLPLAMLSLGIGVVESSGCEDPPVLLVVAELVLVVAELVLVVLLEPFPVELVLELVLG